MVIINILLLKCFYLFLSKRLKLHIEWKRHVIIFMPHLTILSGWMYLRNSLGDVCVCVYPKTFGS